MRAALLQMTLATLVCFPAAAGAQTPAPQPGGQRPAETTTAKVPTPDQIVTIVGCLVQGNGAGGERRSETGAANANDFFIRTPAMTVPVGTTVTLGSPATSTGTSGGGTATSPSSGTASGTATYRITGLDREQLRPHIGHRVELQGHLTGNMGGKGAGGGTGGGQRAGGRDGENKGAAADLAGVLHATAVKMVAPTCP